MILSDFQALKMSVGNRTVEELIKLKVQLAALLSENEELKRRNNQLLRENEQLCQSSASKDKELTKLQCL